MLCLQQMGVLVWFFFWQLYSVFVCLVLETTLPSFASWHDPIQMDPSDARYTPYCFCKHVSSRFNATFMFLTKTPRGTFSLITMTKKVFCCLLAIWKHICRHLLGIHNCFWSATLAHVCSSHPILRKSPV